MNDETTYGRLMVRDYGPLEWLQLALLDVFFCAILAAAMVGIYSMPHAARVLLGRPWPSRRHLASVAALALLFAQALVAWSFFREVVPEDGFVRGGSDRRRLWSGYVDLPPGYDTTDKIDVDSIEVPPGKRRHVRGGTRAVGHTDDGGTKVTDLPMPIGKPEYDPHPPSVGGGAPKKYPKPESAGIIERQKPFVPPDWPQGG